MGGLGQVNLVYARQRTVNRAVTNIVSGTYGIDVGRRRNTRLSASGFVDTRAGNWGATLSISMLLGANVQGYAQQGWRNGAPGGEIQIQGAALEDRLDWQVNAGAAKGVGHLVDAYTNWDGARAELFARATKVNGSAGFQAAIAQSLVAMDGRLFLTGRVDDAFTVVDAGLPDIRVALENRTIGRTGPSGKLLVSDLQSYLPNAISIDPLDLPIDAAAADTSQLVAPRGGAGMVTRFNVARARAAIVVLRRSDGTPPPAGATVLLEGSTFEAPLGFDGEIYVRGLKAGENRLQVNWREGRCTAWFDAPAEAGGLPRLGPFPCAP